MEIILASKNVCLNIMKIIAEAQVYLNAQKIDQWQDGYPNLETIEKDIFNGESYLVVDENKNILATAMFTLSKEPSYVNIEGSWLTHIDAVYGVVHRMAIGEEYRKMGIAQYIISQFEQKLSSKNIPSLRVDTHKDNKGMQRLLTKMGYAYCGVITLYNGNLRLAFEKII